MQELAPERWEVEQAPSLGARNLLLNCANAWAGERLLIAYEPEEFGYIERGVREEISRCANALGLRIDTLDVGFDPTPNGFPDRLRKYIRDADIVLFLARLGDQLRFEDLPVGPRYLTCFALNRTLLGSAFGTADYQAFCELKAAVDACILASAKITITCPRGTNVTGRLPAHVRESTDTTSQRFPMSVFSPVLADEFSGSVALPGFLSGTGARYYDDYTLEFRDDVFAVFDRGRLVRFEGAQGDVYRANAQYDRVATLFNLDRNAVHSWHAGIHPGCGFYWDIRENYEAWGGAAFGNPRVLHFHTCGARPPGEICWNVIDPSIHVDDVALWEIGRFFPERLAEGRAILARNPAVADLFAKPDRHIGFGDVT